MIATMGADFGVEAGAGGVWGPTDCAASTAKPPSHAKVHFALKRRMSNKLALQVRISRQKCLSGLFVAVADCGIDRLHKRPGEKAGESTTRVNLLGRF
jgi:hypothetical protein